jgi:hypothetical protein
MFTTANVRYYLRRHQELIMKAKAQLATVKEADLVQRFAHGYRHRLADIITSLNRSLATSGVDARQQESMRCCVEAVDLVLSSHEQFAKLLGTIASLSSGD